ncbi:MAG: hypothetical protein HN601_13135 [Candidatus Marinimicrobia bacterium]|jgi:hypothetical protein|nr:hypothetical protein [Candidatus Neomarinimicrobiota bacterium]
MNNGILPSYIRHNNNIRDKSKVLFAEINADLGNNGFCTTNNVKFASRLGCSKGTISACLTELRENGYISICILNEEKTLKFIKRYIIPLPYTDFSVGVDESVRTTYTENLVGVLSKNDTPTEKDANQTYTENSDTTITSNSIRKITINKASNNLNGGNIINPDITEKQKAFLEKIIKEFYVNKREQFPRHIQDTWYTDDSITIGSINTLYDLIRIDKWDEIVVRDVIRWSLDDKFWSRNLMSLRVLRKKSPNGMTKFANIQLKWDAV